MSRGINLLIGADVKQAVTELQKLNGFVNNWGSQMRGAMMSAFSFYAVYQGITQVIGSMRDFQTEMSKLKALTGETGERLNGLKENALGLAGAFKAIDIARAQIDLSRAGFSTEEINNSIEAIINLASATGEDLPKSAEIASATLRGFQMDSREMTHVTDVMAASFNKTALDLTSFAEAMKYVAPNARAANISLEETTAMLGILANNGIKGSMAGTALRRIIQDLAKDGRPLSERLAELGKNGLSAADALDEIGRIGSTSLLILANSVPQIDALNTSLKNVDGTTKEMAAIQLDNLAGDWRKLAAAFDTTAQKGTWLTDILRGATTSGTMFWRAIQGNLKEDDLFGGNDPVMKALRGEQIGGGAKPTTSPWGRNATDKALWGKTLDPSTITQTSASWFGGDWVDRQVSAMQDFEKSIQDVVSIQDVAAQSSKAFSDATFDVNRQVQLGENIFDAAGQGLESLDESIDQSDSITKLIDDYGRLNKSMVKIGLTAQQIGNMIRSSITSAFTGLGRVIGNLLSGSNLESTLLGFLGGIAVQVGEMAVGIGLAMLGIQKSLASFSPWAAIGAGVALIALGTFAQNRAAQIGSQSGGGSDGGGSMPRWADKDVSPNGEWRIRGADLVYVLDKQGYRSSVVGG